MLLMIKKEYYHMNDNSAADPRESQLSNGEGTTSEQITGLKFEYE